MQVRRPAVAGTFYEGSEARLRTQLRACYDANPEVTQRREFIGAVVPHAGLMYSGHVAAAVYMAVDLPSRLLILCPNHTGAGHPAAINLSGEWATPLGNVPVDEELAAEFAAAAPLLRHDTAAHAREHSLEVQLPFVQHERSGTRFVPICLALPTFDECERMGRSLASVIARHRDRGEHIGILASSDLNHYEDQETTLAKDQRAIDRILALDPRGLWETVRRGGISMCGIVPATTMLVAANELGATEATLLKHATSGDINGDYSAVVGYAGIVVGQAAT